MGFYRCNEDNFFLALARVEVIFLLFYFLKTQQQHHYYFITPSNKRTYNEDERTSKGDTNLLQDKTIPLETTNSNVLKQKDEAYTKKSLSLLTNIKENKRISSTSQSTEHCLQGCVNDRHQPAGRHNGIPANILFLATRHNRQI